MKKIPLLDLKRSWEEIKQEVYQGWEEVFSSMRILNGKYLQEFEKNWAEYLGVKHAFGCSCGSTALLMALIACGIGKGDEVLLQANAFIADLEAIHLAGAIPVLLEVDPNTFGPDLEDMYKKLSPKTKALILVHMYGHPVEMDEILEFCKKYGIILIEDGSHAHGATYKGKKVGTFGKVGCFSCGPVKNLNCIGDGGVIVTNDDELAFKLKFLRVHGQVEKNHSHFFGFNSRLDELQAVILNARLKTLDQKNEKRREIAKKYHEGLSDLKNLTLPPLDPEYKQSVYHRYVIRTPFRDELVTFLKERGIETGYYYPIPLHLQKSYQTFYPTPLNLPVAEKLAKESVAIPMYPELTEEEITYIINCIRDFYQNKG
ncbi:DegT/DnrJ/EryC1/StrS family aminotransferase [Thermodesulfobacterium sp. TA1]|uniref:DegT/DnrJ/EryC1/StrS family aminotransferase n=1 Tax=Thermodesulfobacterium sp. TA1 TaxID=2234087 RepID=UPI001231EF48|nr:DegT/DnrJ/EryC1/StrS family aminotransferase [Thermodesulfobacterium sp. TA1]QER41453.1 DegT/DnrJ/EryC1/StrS family aminotransferase [Thermodesulfobacterium sp. TA1]